MPLRDAERFFTLVCGDKTKCFSQPLEVSVRKANRTSTTKTESFNIQNRKKHKVATYALLQKVKVPTLIMTTWTVVPNLHFSTFLHQFSKYCVFSQKMQHRTNLNWL